MTLLFIVFLHGQFMLYKGFVIYLLVSESLNQSKIIKYLQSRLFLTLEFGIFFFHKISIVNLRVKYGKYD